MARLRSALLLLAGVTLVVTTACSPAATTTPRPTPTATARPTPSPTPLPPDTLFVGVLGIGIGTYALAAIPVALLKNEAKFHGAASVIVHFVTHRAGRTLGSLESVAVDLGPAGRATFHLIVAKRMVDVPRIRAVVDVLLGELIR